MDFNQVKELIHMIDSSRLVDFSIDFENTKINMSKQSPAAVSALPPAASPKEPAEEPPAVSVPIPPPQEGHTVKSPLVGTFYASATPGEPPLAAVGARVKKGDVLCIIEAMKIMNEIASECDGVVREVLAQNEAMVEYNQPLFVIA